MKLKIKGNEIELVYSFRSGIYFESITGHNLDFSNMSGNDLISLFYAVVVASLQKAKEPIVSMLDFMDAIDDDGGEQCLLEFSNWYVEQLKAQYEIEEPIEEKEIKEEKVIASKKKKS